MKRCIVLVFFVLCTMKLCAYANTTVYLQSDKAFVRTKANTLLYKLSPNEISNILSSSNRRIIDVGNCQTLSMVKSVKAQIFAYSNTRRNFLFDSYIILYKGCYWCVQSDFVEDNVYLDSKNAELEKRRLQLQKALNVSTEKYTDMQSFYKKECCDSLALYKQRISDGHKYNDSILGIAQRQVDELLQTEQNIINAQYTSWFNALPKSSQRVMRIIKINKYELSNPNSAGGCDVLFEYRNLSQKTIKYIYIDVATFNAVGDLVNCRIRETFLHNLVDTGPIKCNDDGKCLFKNIIYNYSARYIKLVGLKIVYVDGSEVKVSQSDLENILTEPSKGVSFDKQVQAEQILMNAQKNKIYLYDYQQQVSVWQNRLDRINKHSFGYDNKELVNHNNYNGVYAKLGDLLNVVNRSLDEYQKFAVDNFIELK